MLNNEKTSERVKLAFVMFTNLKVGAGTETTLFNYIKFVPKELFDLTVIQTDYSEKSRLSQEYVSQRLKGIRVVEWSDFKNKFKFLQDSRIGEIFLRTVIEPVLMSLTYHFVYKKLAKDFIEYDIIYLYSNQFSKFFRKSKALVIGTSHTGLSNDRGILNRINTRLIQERLLYPRIDGYHLFPYHALQINLFKTRHNFILSNGVDTTLYHLSNTKDTSMKLKFLFVGRLEICKGIIRLLNAWKNMQSRNDVELHIVGDGSLGGFVSSKSIGNVIYHGKVELLRLAELYRSCDVLIHPSQCDTLTLVVLEAASSGLYILESDWLKGTYDDLEENGFLEYIDVSVDGISQKIDQCASNIDIIRAKKAKISQYVIENYDWEKISSALFDKLKKML